MEAALEASRPISPASFGKTRRPFHPGIGQMTALAASTFLIFNYVTPIVNHPARYRLNKQGSLHVPVDAGLDTRMGVTWATPPIAQPMRGNYGAEVNLRRLQRGSLYGRGMRPETPHRFGV
jgi:hypothetical protein